MFLSHVETYISKIWHAPVASELSGYPVAFLMIEAAAAYNSPGFKSEEARFVDKQDLYNILA